MAETPARRGPGRPRKVAPKPEAAELDEAPIKDPTGAPVPLDPHDPRIGMEVHPTATHVGFDDGTQYLAAGGVITERVT